MIIKIKLLKGRLCEKFVGSDVDDGGQTSVVLLIHHQPSLLLPWADSETSEESTQAASPPTHNAHATSSILMSCIPNIL